MNSLLLKLNNMGNQQSKIEDSIHRIEQSQIKTQIDANIQANRLNLNHVSNVYQKCEFLVTHYDEYVQKFEELYLTHNMISKEVMSLLAKMKVLNLKALSLSNNDISCMDLQYLQNMPFKNLHYLFLDHNMIANEGCVFLARAEFKNLLTIDLSYNKIGDQGCRNLQRALFLNLRTLLINYNKFGEKGLLYLSKGQWMQLAFVQAKNNQFQPTKELEITKFFSKVKAFRLEIQ